MKKDDIIKLEYEKTQDSAEHYNTMTWTLIAVGIGFSLLLLKFTLLDLLEENFFNVNNYSLQNLAISIGLFVILYFRNLVEGASEKKVFKYGICKIIEKENNFYGQNSEIDNLLISGKHDGIKFFRTSLLILVLLFSATSLFLMANFSSQTIKMLPEIDITNTLIVYGTFLSQIILVWYFFKYEKFYEKSETKVQEILKKLRREKLK